MNIPSLTHLQYAVLCSLMEGTCSGKELRELLAKGGASQSRPAFYQLMARLEEAGFVGGKPVQKIVEGITVTERQYKITAPGKRAVSETKAFYVSDLGFRAAFA
ncbi:hypothetical protein [Schlesneria paludicola]|uniref:hypothetical protein n=1 Tax=Schlesneria paludicola TaxID=360056 RepID=UPI00029B0C2D|nr:hypothetical protein [Schlesneria paludicola]